MKLEIGSCYFVRTLSDYWVGRLVDVGPFTLTLEDASWVADTGRLAEFMRHGKAENMEIEPVGLVMCSNGPAVLSWPHKLFTKAVP